MLRRIVSISYYRSHCKVGHGTAVCKLECGHTHRMKKSQLKPGQVRCKCRQCETAFSETVLAISESGRSL